MATFADLATLALQELMVLQSNETASSSDLSLCLTKANLMLDQWAAESLMIPNMTRSTWNIVSGTSSYSVGTGGAVNIVRPEFVSHVTFQDSAITPLVEVPLVELTDDAYAAYTIKTLQSKYPQNYWYSPTYAGDLATLILLPVPTASTLTGVIYAQTALVQIAATSTTITLPPGYKNMLVTNLAVNLAPFYEREPSDVLSKEAARSLAVVQRKNIRLADLQVDRGALIQGAYWDRTAFYSGI